MLILRNQLLTGLLCLWTLGLGLVDFLLWRDYGLQLRTYRYSGVTGQLQSAERSLVRGAKGKGHYGLSCTYSYRVEGREYHGQRYRYGQLRGQQTDWINEFLSAHPVGSEIEVFYAADRPEESVLVKGLQGSDLCLLLLVSPFHAAALGGWFWLLGRSSSSRSLLRRVGAAGVSASGSLGCLSFPAVFGVFLILGDHPKLTSIASVWVVIGLVVLSSAWGAFRAPESILKD